MNEIEQIVDATANGRWNLGLTPQMLAKLLRYAEMLVDWNTRLNLTRITDPNGIAVKHFLDSLAILHLVRIDPGTRLIDVGTGAGLPGVALKIVRPDLDIVLLDSTAKKLAFCDAVIADLGLTGIRTVHARAEDLARDPSHARAYPITACRALAALEKLLPWCAPLAAPGGRIVALKGAAAADEVRAAAAVARRLGVRIAAPIPVDLPGEEASAHTLVVARVGAAALRRASGLA